ncbi:SDR family oxidoreductase [bacterium]|nr:SDR family oxidoreductase [bacterium]
MNILVTGACGYKGSVLVPLLLEKGHNILAVDSEWFGNFLIPHPNLSYQKKDIRDLAQGDFQDIDVVIHLANVANDPAVELNPTLSWEVNVLCSQQICEFAIRNKVKHMIYASSGSVYGLKDEPNVTEDLSLVPISTYNKTKMVAERVFLSYSNFFKVHCIRPATVCGLSPRMRLDVAVNMLTYQALTKHEITILGGDQTRPNIHIDDIANLYLHLISNCNSIESGCYNAGFENISIREIANMIQNKVSCKLNFKESNDPRSYRQDSSKILGTGFKPIKSVSIAIDEIIAAFESGNLPQGDNCFTVKWMKQNNFS